MFSLVPYQLRRGLQADSDQLYPRFAGRSGSNFQRAQRQWVTAQLLPTVHIHP
jgi:hypothetical protein